MKKRDILDLSHKELMAYLESIGEASFRASQVFKWIYQKGVQQFGQMSDLSSGLRARMNEDFTFLKLRALPTTLYTG